MLKLAQVYGAIAFYLDHKTEIGDYLAKTEREFESSSIPLAEANPMLWEKLQRAKMKMGETSV